MGPYGGQDILISTVVTNFDGTVLISPNVTSVTLDIADPTRTALVNGQAMSYDAGYVNSDGTIGAYIFIWPSPATAEGAYIARIVAVGPNLHSRTYKTIRIRRNKDPYDV